MIKMPIIEFEKEKDIKEINIEKFDLPRYMLLFTYE